LIEEFDVPAYITMRIQRKQTSRLENWFKLVASRITSSDGVCMPSAITFFVSRDVSILLSNTPKGSMKIIMEPFVFVANFGAEEGTYFETRPIEVILAGLAESWKRLQHITDEVTGKH
jgi:hypothetical protein